jgi:hypothetical protein
MGQRLLSLRMGPWPANRRVGRPHMGQWLMGEKVCLCMMYTVLRCVNYTHTHSDICDASTAMAGWQMHPTVGSQMHPTRGLRWDSRSMRRGMADASHSGMVVGYPWDIHGKCIYHGTIYHARASSKPPPRRLPPPCAGTAACMLTGMVGLQMRDGEVVGWWDGGMARWQVGTMAGCQDGKMVGCQMMVG